MSRRMNKVVDFYLELKSDAATAFRLQNIKNNLVLLMGSDRGDIYVYNTSEPGKSQINITDPSGASITCLQMLKGTNHVVSGNVRGLISILDIETGKSFTSFAKHLTTITSIQNFFYKEQCFVSGSLDTTVRVWDLRQKLEVAIFKGHSQQVNTIDVTPDDAWVVSGSDDSSVKFWDVSQNKLFQEIKNDPPGSVLSLAINPSDFQIAYGGNDRSATFYNIENFKLQSKVPVAASPISYTIFDDSGNSLYTLGTNFMKIVSATSYEIVETIEANWKAPGDLLFMNGDVFGLGRIANGCRLHKLGLNIEKLDDNKLARKPEKMMIEEPTSSQPALTEEEELAEIDALRRAHNQIYNSLNDKYMSVSSVVNFFFEQGNIAAARIAIEKTYEPKNITDILNIFSNPKVLDRLPIEFCTMLLKKAGLLFENKYKFYIKTALKFSKESLKRFAQDIISLKSFSQMSKYDLEREERIKKYDGFLAEVDAMVKHKMFNKLMAQFQNEEIGELSQNLINDYRFILDAVKRGPV